MTVVCPGWVRTRIHEADRNKPAGVPGLPEGQEGAAGLRDIVTGLIEGGLDPAEVAEQIVAAVRAERFYVLTHEGWAEMARARMERIVSGENPTITLPSATDCWLRRGCSASGSLLRRLRTSADPLARCRCAS